MRNRTKRALSACRQETMALLAEERENKIRIALARDPIARRSFKSERASASIQTQSKVRSICQKK